MLVNNTILRSGQQEKRVRVAASDFGRNRLRELRGSETEHHAALACDLRC